MIGYREIPDQRSLSKGQELLWIDRRDSKDLFYGSVKFRMNAICFVHQGTTHLAYADAPVQFGEGDFLMIRAGNILTRVPAGTNDFSCSVLLFSNERLARILRKIGVKRNYRSNIEQIQRFEMERFVETWLGSTSGYSTFDDNAQALFLELKFEELIIRLCHEEAPGLLLASGISDAEQTTHFKTVVEANITSDLSIEGLAALCDTNESTFVQRFFRIYGETPRVWFRNRRLHKAAEILRTGPMPLNDLAAMCGFKCGLELERDFAKRYKQSPDQYAESWQ